MYLKELDVWQTLVTLMTKRLVGLKGIYQKITMYLSRFQNLFLNFSKGISTNFKMYLPKLQKVFVQISKCICPNFEMYLPNTVIPMIKRLVGLAGLLSSLSLLLPTAESFMNCSVLLSTNIFSSSMMVMMILMIAKGSLRSATLPRYTLQKCAFPN